MLTHFSCGFHFNGNARIPDMEIIFFFCAEHSLQYYGEAGTFSLYLSPKKFESSSRTNCFCAR